MRKSRRMWYPKNYIEKIETFFINDRTDRIVVFPEINNMQMYNVPFEVIYAKTYRYKIYLLKPGDNIKIRGMIGRNESTFNSKLCLIPPANKKMGPQRFLISHLISTIYCLRLSNWYPVIHLPEHNRCHNWGP